jgi:ABC-type phosphate transport system substrate-binding protein
MKARLKILNIFIVAVVTALSFHHVASAGEAVVIIANKNVPVSSLSIKEVNNIFLGKRGQWVQGSKIEIVILEGCAAHDVFLKSYLQKTPSQYDRYFRTLVFTGKGKAPRIFSTETEVVSYVSINEGAIGYVSSETDTRSVKIIIVD